MVTHYGLAAADYTERLNGFERIVGYATETDWSELMALWSKNYKTSDHHDNLFSSTIIRLVSAAWMGQSI